MFLVSFEAVRSHGNSWRMWPSLFIPGCRSNFHHWNWFVVDWRCWTHLWQENASGKCINNQTYFTLGFCWSCIQTTFFIHPQCVNLIIWSALRSSCPKVIATEVMSPESFGEVGRNAELRRPKFIMLNNILTSLLYIYSELVSSHQRFKNAMYYSFIALVSCHQGLKNEIYYTFIPLVSSHNRLKNEAYYTHSLLLCKVHLMKFRATQPKISSETTLVHGRDDFLAPWPVTNHNDSHNPL